MGRQVSLSLVSGRAEKCACTNALPVLAVSVSVPVHRDFGKFSFPDCRIVPVFVLDGPTTWESTDGHNVWKPDGASNQVMVTRAGGDSVMHNEHDDTNGGK